MHVFCSLSYMTILLFTVVLVGTRRADVLRILHRAVFVPLTSCSAAQNFV